MVFFLCEKKAYIFDIQRPYLFCTLSAPSRGKIWNFFPHHLSLRYMNEFLVYMALPEQCAVCSFACQHPTWTIFTWMIFNFHWSHGIESFLWVIQCCSMGVVEFAPLCNDQHYTTVISAHSLLLEMSSDKCRTALGEKCHCPFDGKSVFILVFLMCFNPIIMPLCNEDI